MQYCGAQQAYTITLPSPPPPALVVTDLCPVTQDSFRPDPNSGVLLDQKNTGIATFSGNVSVRMNSLVFTSANDAVSFTNSGAANNVTLTASVDGTSAGTVLSVDIGGSTVQLMYDGNKFMLQY